MWGLLPFIRANLCAEPNVPCRCRRLGSVDTRFSMALVDTPDPTNNWLASWLATG